MPVAEIQLGGKSFKNIRYVFRKFGIFTKITQFRRTIIFFCELCEKGARFPWVEFVGVSCLKFGIHVFLRM